MLRLRCPRFTLRTLFVLLTLCGVWLGLQAKWLKDRRRYLAENPSARLCLGSAINQSQRAAPGLLGLFGERGQARLEIDIPGAWDYQKNRVRKDWLRLAHAEGSHVCQLFPEAQVEIISTEKDRILALMTSLDGGWEYNFLPGPDD